MTKNEEKPKKMIRATRNQRGNVNNPYQTGAKRVLVVCSAGLLRSPTGANVLHQEFGYNTRSAGSSEDFALIPVSEALICWADEIVFVNHGNFHECKFKNEELWPMIEGKAIVLDIEDNFCWNDQQLKEQFLQQYKEKMKND